MNLEEKLLDKRLDKKLGYTTRKYVKYLGQEEVNQCKKIGIWKAWKHWKEDGGAKFDNYAAQKVEWECINAVKKLSKHNNRNVQLRYEGKICSQSEDNKKEVFILLDSVTEDQSEMLKSKYIENKTLKEIAKEKGVSHESIRLLIEKAKINARS